jgi:hypothetical protein
MPSVERVIADETSRWKTTAVEQSVFGTGDAVAIAGLIDQFCRQHLGSPISEGLFYRSSVGCVIGLTLADGHSVVLKAYQPRWSKVFLDAIGTVQGNLAGQGFPCATPVLAATPLSQRQNLVIAETWLPDPGMTALDGPKARAISARGLARQIELSRESGDLVALREHPMAEPSEGLYPEPHSPLFDLVGTSDGAEWIDAFARQARELRVVDDTPRIVAHTDWCARNVRIAEDLVAVYDWDSVSLVTESTAVGQAAATWSVTSEPGGSTFPSAAQIAAFIGAYELASGRTWNDEQWKAAGGAATYLLAYVARCEHSLAVVGRARPDQHGASSRLKSDGPDLLDLSSSMREE